MSKAPATSGKWVSSRVQKQQQQQQPGSKIMEDAAIAAARIKENQQSSPTTGPEVEIPQATVFERQQATDALSNLAHNADTTVNELLGEPKFSPVQTCEEFDEKFNAVTRAL